VPTPPPRPTETPAAPPSAPFGLEAGWSPQTPRFSLPQLVLSLLVTAVGTFVAAAIVPGISVGSFGDALLAAVLIAVLNALLPPLVAALRLPFTLVLGFLVVLVLDALILLLVSHIDSNAFKVESFGWALLGALVISAMVLLLQVMLGVNDEDTYTLRVITRIARRQGERVTTDVPGLVLLEIDGLALPVLERAIRDGATPNMARWLESGDFRLDEWETDLSSQTGASQAGILLGSNDNIPAFRWVEKDTGRLVSCSSPQDCALIEGRLASGIGLLIEGGASRGNLFSGEADAAILTASRISAERQANPGYRSFLANGFNVTRLLVLFFWEVIIEWVAAAQQRRRDVRPRGRRGGRYPFLRAAMCVGVRDLIVFAVLTDMMRGRPVVYATFSSYDEVAHHSGLERADTLEALRKLDQQFGRIERARRYAPRPYQFVVLSDHGQTQGATFKQRNGYDLRELVERSISRGRATEPSGREENEATVNHAVAEATGRGQAAEQSALGDRDVVVLASGNLGLIYLMEERRRLSMEEIEERHPQLLEALRRHPHVGLLMVHSRDHGAIVLGGRGANYLDERRVVGEDPLAGFPPSAGGHLRRADGFEHAPDVLVNSFYDPHLEQGCAFEELISFHGGLGGSQTRPFILHPAELRMPSGPVVGAAAVHEILVGWRRALQHQPPPPAPAPETVAGNPAG
jgi:uncharacterized membrane protein YvlD (DUF360 family)